MKLFKKLSKKEEIRFRAWARQNYAAFTPINGLWHPVVQSECAKINEEADINLRGLQSSDAQPA